MRESESAKDESLCLHTSSALRPTKRYTGAVEALMTRARDAQGHMTYLKKFGLELFEHVLPVEYDDMNTFAKVDAILDLVTNCAIKEMYFDNLDRIQHNHELVASDKIGKQIVDEIRNFVLNH